MTKGYYAPFLVMLGFVFMFSYPHHANAGYWLNLKTCGDAEVLGFGTEEEFSTSTLFKSRFAATASKSLREKGCKVVRLGCNVCSEIIQNCEPGEACVPKMICSAKSCYHEEPTPVGASCDWSIAKVTCEQWSNISFAVRNDEILLTADASEIFADQQTINQRVKDAEQQERSLPVILPASRREILPAPGEDMVPQNESETPKGLLGLQIDLDGFRTVPAP